jgi:hypothetical protein
VGQQQRKEWVGRRAGVRHLSLPFPPVCKTSPVRFFDFCSYHGCWSGAAGIWCSCQRGSASTTAKTAERRRGGRRRGRGPGGARRRPCGAARRSFAGAGRLPRAGAQLAVDCVLLMGGVTGAGAGLRRMPRGRWRPAIGGRPHRRPPRRRASPTPFFLADCGGLSVGWVSCRT